MTRRLQYFFITSGKSFCVTGGHLTMKMCYDSKGNLNILTERYDN